MNRAFYIKRNGLFVPDRCQVNPSFLGSWKKPVSGGGGGGGGATKLFGVGIGGTSGGCTTSAANATGSTLFVGGTGGYRSPVPGQSDSQSNTWTALTAQTPGGGVATRLWYVSSPSISSSQTFSADGGDVGTVASSDGALGFSGVTVLDSEAAGNSLGNVFTNIQPGSITPSQSGEVFVAALRWDSGASTTWAIDSGFTIEFQVATGFGEGFALAWKIKTDSTAENPIWTPTGTLAAAATVMAAFK